MNKNTSTQPTYGQDSQTTREDVERLICALALVFPGTDVQTTHAGQDSMWVLRVVIQHPKAIRACRIVEEIDGWRAYMNGSTTALVSFSPDPDLIRLVRAVYNYTEIMVGDLSHAEGM